MTRRLTLICHGETSATRTAAFPGDEALEDSAIREAEAIAGHFKGISTAACSPAECALQTATALGLKPREEGAIRDLDYGRWTRRSVAEVHAAEPDSIAIWMSEFSAAPHGGESIEALWSRVGAWMERLAGGSGRLLAVSHQSVIRAAVLHALAAPLPSFWRLDIGPLSATELSHDGRRWAVRAMAVPLAASKRGAPTS